ncbi:MAG: methyl-accepting chemotaxis protein [Lachnospiraceae bacterium]|nr:methyl-accepting chemotaxis protein [Lachnospiraceae bacterium]
MPFVVGAAVCFVCMILIYFSKNLFPNRQIAYAMCLFYGIETLLCTFAYSEYSVMLYLVVMLIMGIMYQNKKFLIYAAIICVIMTLAGEAVGCVFLGWDYSKAGLSIFIVTAIAVSVIMSFSHVQHVNAQQFEQINSKCDEINSAKENIMSLNKITLDSIQEMTTYLNDSKQSSKELDSSVADNVESISSISADLQGISKIIHGTQQGLDDSLKHLSEIISDTEKSLQMTQVCNVDVQNVELNSGNIEKLVDDIREDTSVLNQEISNVNDILNIVREISDEISLLSLNAMIEASRAGEFGRGFSVVANEMQGLSENSLKSLSKITEIIEVFVQKANSTIEGINNVNTELINQRTSIDNATKNISDLADYMEKLEKKINTIVLQIEESIKENSAVAEQITELSGVSEKVMVATESLRGISTDVYEKSEKIDDLASKISEEMQRIC